MSEDYVVVNSILSYRIRYVMHKDDLQKLNPDKPCNSVEWAKDTVTCEECDEFSTEYIGEHIYDADLITEEQMINLFDRDNSHIKKWSREQKIDWVRMQK